MTESFFDIDLRGLTRNQKLLLALLYRYPEMAATPEQIKTWFFNRTTIFSLQRRQLLAYSIERKRYELNIDVRVFDAAAKAARWAVGEYPQFRELAA